ncbi:MAG: hypothetical protein ACRD15_13725 [Vicinamibacterales bacterium]
MTRTIVTFGVVAVLMAVAAGQATDDKILVVRDGSVLLTTDSLSKVDDKHDGKHKWNRKGRTVQIFGASAANACAAPQHTDPVAFEYVRFEVEDTSGGQSFDVTARNESPFFLLFFIKHLKLEVGAAEFVGDAQSRQLRRGSQSDTLRLRRIILKQPEQNEQTIDRAAGSLSRRSEVTPNHCQTPFCSSSSKSFKIAVMSRRLTWRSLTCRLRIEANSSRASSHEARPSAP